MYMYVKLPPRPLLPAPHKFPYNFANILAIVKKIYIINGFRIL